MNNWKEVRLGEVIQYMSKGVAPKYTESNENSIIVLNQKCNRDNRINLELARKNDLILKKVPTERVLIEFDIVINSTGTGTAGRVAQIKKMQEIMTVDGHMIILRILDSFNKEYIGYNILSQQSKIELLAEGSTGQTEINKQRLLNEIIIKYPINIYEQKAIADTLSCLDDKIELNQKMNKNLEEQAQAIFKSWFVDFELFKGREFIESELGMIPKGFRVGTLGEVCTILTGKRPPVKEKSKTPELFVPVIGASGIMAYTNAVLMENEFISTGRVGTHGVINRYSSPVWVSDNAFIITGEFQEYVYQILRSVDYTSLNRGSTQPLITQTDLKNIKVVIPAEDVLSEFELISKTLMMKINENNKQTETLKQLRDTLLPKLMSGEVRVPFGEV